MLAESRLQLGKADIDYSTGDSIVGDDTVRNAVIAAILRRDSSCLELQNVLRVELQLVVGIVVVAVMVVLESMGFSCQLLVCSEN